MATTMRDPVGKSGVTPCKHLLLNRMIGQVCGVLSTGSLPVNGATFYDLTAGDGVPRTPAQGNLPLDSHNLGPFDQHCLPGIYLRHLNAWAARRHAQPIRLVMSEMQPSTFSSLRANSASYLLANGWDEVENDLWRKGSATVQFRRCMAQEVPPPGIASNQATHVYADPNLIQDWALAPEFIAGCPPFTTSITTLGCNVGGSKRLPYEERLKWYDRVNQVTEAIVKSWHDACLLSVGGASQWAYLITAPSKWRDKTTETCLRAARQIEGRNAKPQIAWMNTDPSGYARLLDVLFLTKKELEAAA